MADATTVVARLRERTETVSVAETTAGGLILASLIAVPGASAVTPGGIVPYDNRPKMALLDIPRDLLKAHGAVSHECAAAMAEAVRAKFGTAWGLAETGISGPTGGTDEKPAGTVFAAIAGPGGTETQRWRFAGERAEVMDQVAREMLRWFESRLAEG